VHGGGPIANGTVFFALTGSTFASSAEKSQSIASERGGTMTAAADLAGYPSRRMQTTSVECRRGAGIGAIMPARSPYRTDAPMFFVGVPWWFPMPNLTTERRKSRRKSQAIS
jgi:hypothetical protein